MHCSHWHATARPLRPAVPSVQQWSSVIGLVEKYSDETNALKNLKCNYL